MLCVNEAKWFSNLKSFCDYLIFIFLDNKFYYIISGMYLIEEIYLGRGSIMTTEFHSSFWRFPPFEKGGALLLTLLFLVPYFLWLLGYLIIKGLTNTWLIYGGIFGALIIPLTIILFVAFFKTRTVSLSHEGIVFKVIKKKTILFKQIVAVYTFTTQGSIRIHIYDGKIRVVDIGFGFGEDDKKKIIEILRQSVDLKNVDFREDISLFKLLEFEMKLKKEYQKRSRKKQLFRSWSEKRCPICQGTMEFRSGSTFNAKCEECNYNITFGEFLGLIFVISFVYLVFFTAGIIFIAIVIKLPSSLIPVLVVVLIITLILVMFRISSWIVQSKWLDKYISL